MQALIPSGICFPGLLAQGDVQCIKVNVSMTIMIHRTYIEVWFVKAFISFTEDVATNNASCKSMFSIRIIMLPCFAHHCDYALGFVMGIICCQIRSVVQTSARFSIDVHGSDSQKGDS